MDKYFKLDWENKLSIAIVVTFLLGILLSLFGLGWAFKLAIFLVLVGGCIKTYLFVKRLMKNKREFSKSSQAPQNVGFVLKEHTGSKNDFHITEDDIKW